MHRTSRPSTVALAVAALLASLTGPALAAITSSGDVGPDPSSGLVAGRLDIGPGTAGQVRVDGGSLLAMQQLGLGGSSSGIGTLVVSGVDSRVVVDGLNSGNGNFDLGGWGAGALSVLAGASFAHGVNTSACLSGCASFIGNAAGSSGSLLVSGAGSSFSTLGRITVGLGGAFTTAAGDGFNYGTPGAATSGTVRVEAGALMRGQHLVVGSSGGGKGRTGAESATGNLVVDGAGSLLALTRPSTTAGDASLLSIANGVNAVGSAAVRNGAKLTLDGSAAPAVFSGINIGSGGLGSSGQLVIDGPGSLIELSGGQGFINVGTNVAGSVGTMQITGGGRVAGVGPTGLAFTTVGRNGATGTLTVSGNDAAGNASTLRLAGRNSETDGGAFLNVGGVYNASTGTGTVNILAGGRIEVDTTTVVTNTGARRPGAYVGVGQGSSGTLNISGKSALTGAASTLAITGGTGVTPFVGVGRDGATGNVLVSDGGRWLVSSARVSSDGANGDLLQLSIGDRSAGSDNPGPNPSIGTVTVTGAGSELALTGAADRYISVGTGNGALGTLDVGNGGVVRSLSLLVGSGAGATGAVNVHGGRIELGGTVNAGAAAGTGGSFTVGRNGGAGTATFSNGAVLQITTATPNASINAGGTGPAPGGVGTIHVLDGSLLAVSGPGATLRVGGASSATSAGVGTLNLSGAGSSVQLVGDGARALIGAAGTTVGTVNIGAGATLSAGSLIGVAHDGTADTGGTGRLIVNGVASATRIVNGVGGLIQGSGTLVGEVINHGTINPGESPGRLVIDGSFANAAGGQLVLEVASDGHGGFVTDQLVFTSPATVDLAGMQVEFRFLGNADPTAFQASGDFDTETFFRQRDAQGQDAAMADTAFGAVLFTAASEAYVIDDFSFDAGAGALFTATPVPEPATWALWMTGVLGLAGLAKRRRRAAAG